MSIVTKAAPKARKKTQAGGAAPARVPELIFGDLWEFDPAPETADPKLKAFGRLAAHE